MTCPSSLEAALETLRRHNIAPEAVTTQDGTAVIRLRTPADTARAWELLARLQAHHPAPIRVEGPEPPPPAPGDPFADFIPHPGAEEALRAVRSFTAAGAEGAGFGRILLYGPAGTGKSHLLLAARQALQIQGRRVALLFGPAGAAAAGFAGAAGAEGPGCGWGCSSETVIIWDDAPADLKARLGPGPLPAALLVARREPAPELLNAGFEPYGLGPVPAPARWAFFAALLEARGIRPAEALRGTTLRADTPGQLKGLADRVRRLHGPGPLSPRELRALVPTADIPRPGPEAVEAAFFRVLGTDPDKLRGRDRSGATTRLRALLALLLREETDLSLAAIGRRLGGRDHTTVLYWLEVAENLAAADRDFAQTLAAVRAELRR